MLRSARELKTLDDLPVSNATLCLLKRKEYTPEEAIQIGRHYHHITRTVAAQIPKWRIEFIDALDRAGFIRHDIDERTYGVIGLYISVLDGEYEPEYAQMLRFENDFYENMRSITDREILKFRVWLASCLEVCEVAIVELHNKLEDGTSWRVAEIAKRLDISSLTVSRMEAHATQKLRYERNRSRMPIVNLGA